MTLSEKQMSHPKFVAFSNTANRVLADALKAHGMTTDLLMSMEAHAGRVVDEMTSLLLRADRLSKRGAR